MKIRLEYIAAIAIIAALISYHALSSYLVEPTAWITGGQILKEYWTDEQGWVRGGYWSLFATVTYPPGDIIMEGISMPTPEMGPGAEATTIRRITLSFDSYSPWYRGTLSLVSWRNLQIEEISLLGGIKRYYWKCYEFQWYEIELWRDVGVPYQVRMSIDAAEVSRQKVLMGSTVGVDSTDSFRMEWVDPTTMQREGLDFYNLGYFNRGMVSPPEKYAFVYSPIGEIRIVDASKLHAHLLSKGYRHHFNWMGTSGIDWWETYSEHYHGWELDKVGPVSNAAEIRMMLDPNTLELIDKTMNTLFSDFNPVPKIITCPLVDRGDDWGWIYWFDDVPREMHGAIYEKRTGYQIYSKGKTHGVNPAIAIMADATLFDTIIWRVAAGKPEYVSHTKKTTGYAGSSVVVEVKIKNVGQTKDTFKAWIDIGPEAAGLVTWEPITGEIQLEVGQVGSILMKLTCAPELREGQVQDFQSAIYVKNLGEPSITIGPFMVTHEWSGATTPVAFGAVSGLVIDKETGMPLDEAWVYAPGSWEMTRAGGKFYLSQVPTGRQEITATKLGWKSQTKSVEVFEGTTVSVVFELGRDVDDRRGLILFAIAAVIIVTIIIGYYYWRKRRLR